MIWEQNARTPCFTLLAVKPVPPLAAVKKPAAAKCTKTKVCMFCKVQQGVFGGFLPVCVQQSGQVNLWQCRWAILCGLHGAFGGGERSL
jgi:hypothetical protein